MQITYASKAIQRWRGDLLLACLSFSGGLCMKPVLRLFQKNLQCLQCSGDGELMMNEGVEHPNIKVS